MYGQDDIEAILDWPSQQCTVVLFSDGSSYFSDRPQA